MALETLDFRLSYSADVVEFSASGVLPHREYAARSSAVGSWLHVRVEPSGGAPWTGAFKLSDGQSVALYGMPSGEELLVVAGGDGYVVSTANPDRWYRPPIMPVCGVRRVIGCSIVLLWDSQNLIACGREGVLWEAERLGDDELAVERADQSGVIGSAWRGGAPGTGRVDFVIEPMTGNVLKGARSISDPGALD
jgi:hypothetical protein